MMAAASVVPSPQLTVDWPNSDRGAPRLASLKLSLTAVFGKSSTRPSFPKLIVALLFAAVATTLSEKTVAPEIAA